MPSQTPIPQEIFIELMHAFGLPHYEDGTCGGIALMAVQSFLAEELNVFDERCFYVNNKRARSVVPADSAQELANDVKNIHATIALKKQLNLPIQLTNEEKKLLDIESFCHGTALAQGPARYPSVFSMFVPQRDVNTIAPFVVSKRLEEQGGMVQADAWSGIYNNAELEAYLALLRKAAKSKQEKLAMTIGDINHRTALCYDPKRDTWHYIDPNELPSVSIKGSDYLTLIKHLRSGLEEQSEYIAFNTGMFGLGNKAAIESMKDTLRTLKYDEFIHLHRITKRRAKLISQSKKNSLVLLNSMDGRADTIPALKRANANFNLGDKDGNSALHIALLNADKSLFKSLMQTHANVNSKNKKGRNALHMAASCNLLDLLDPILASIDDIDAVDKKGCTALHLAVKWGNVDVIAHLAKQGADLTIRNIYKKTPAEEAVSRGKVEVLQTLQQCGVDLTAKNFSGMNLVHIALHSRRSDMFLPLANLGVDLNQADNYGREPIVLAVQNDDADAILALHKAGADFNLVGQYGITLLHSAAMNGKAKAVRVLLELGFHPDYLSDANCSALYFAVKYGQVEAARELLNVGANYRMYARSDLTMMHVAAQFNQPEMIKLLAAYGLLINEPNAYGITPAAIAVKNGNIDVLREFAKGGVDLMERLPCGKKLIDIALERKQFQIAGYINQLANYQFNPSTFFYATYNAPVPVAALTNQPFVSMTALLTA